MNSGFLGGWFLLANFVFEFETFQEFSNWCWGGISFFGAFGVFGVVAAFCSCRLSSFCF